MRSSAIFVVLVGALAGASACGSDIDLPGSTSTTGSGAGSGSTGAGVGSGSTDATTGSGAGTGSGSTGAGAGSGSTGAGAGSGSTGAGAGSGSTSAGAGSGSTGSNGSSSVGSGSTGSGGTPPSKVCSDCAQLAIEGPCQAAFEACDNSFACTTLLDCHSKCEWTDACNQDCDEIIPSGVAMLKDLIGCIACEQCTLPCAGSTLTIYCQ